jgi:hypothetical protein
MAIIPASTSAAQSHWHAYGALEPELLACHVARHMWERKRSCPVHPVAYTAPAGRNMCELLQETFEQRAAIRW